MPNGDPKFNLDEQEKWFGRIAAPIKSFVAGHGLVLDKYYHDGAGWDLRFGHPRGGNASIQVMNAGDVARFSTVWYLVDYDQFTLFLHWRDPIDVKLDSESISRALLEEFEAILATPLGQWTKIATGYKREWGIYSKAQFEAMGPSYPLPRSLQDADYVP